ncbi:MAG: tol-pal system-associated acyl-CoA thioesterase [Rhodobacteraceae bacterium]|nr:tol-pal system-associated acyl-CoA thioesterase [Paracoccaceae bacterium]
MHDYELRVFYEDTDLAGHVYYANYLCFIERARTEMLRSAGIRQSELRAEHGITFVVRRLTAEYNRGAYFDDMLRVRTRITTPGAVRLEMAQDIFRDDEHLFAARVGLVCVNARGRPDRMPDDVLAALGKFVSDDPA